MIIDKCLLSLCIGHQSTNPKASARTVIVIIIIIIIIIIITTTTTTTTTTAVELSLCASSPYSSTDKTNKNKYT
jgi:hypothetical protein